MLNEQIYRPKIIEGHWRCPDCIGDKINCYECMIDDLLDGHETDESVFN